YAWHVDLDDQTLANADIPIHIVTTSEIKISAVIPQAHLQKAATSLHTEFALDS
ncbi:MAG: hypothetical protein V4760_03335, partial [Bdellovibrionota bacterium]